MTGASCILINHVVPLESRSKNLDTHSEVSSQNIVIDAGNTDLDLSIVMQIDIVSFDRESGDLNKAIMINTVMRSSGRQTESEKSISRLGEISSVESRTAHSRTCYRTHKIISE